MKRVLEALKSADVGPAHPRWPQWSLMVMNDDVTRAQARGQEEKAYHHWCNKA